MLARAHRAVGLAALAVFIGTGIYLKFRYPAWEGVSAPSRFLFRANHVYILLSAMLNLALALSPPTTARGRRLGSCLVLVAPVVLLLAFATEPAKASPVRPFTEAGIIMLAAGVLLRSLGRSVGR